MGSLGCLMAQLDDRDEGAANVARKSETRRRNKVFFLTFAFRCRTDRQTDRLKCYLIRGPLPYILKGDMDLLRDTHYRTFKRL